MVVVNYHALFLQQKKIQITKSFFYYFLFALMWIVLFTTIGFVLDLTTNANLQNEYRSSINNTSQNISNTIDVVIIKFITIIIFAISFCILLWLGIKKIAYGYVFTIVYLVVFSFAFAYNFILSLKVFWYDGIQMTFSLFIILGLLIWGFRQRYHRAMLKQKLSLNRSRL